MLLVKHMKIRAWYGYGHSTEMVARKMSADFGTEMPSKVKRDDLFCAVNWPRFSY